MAAHELEQSVSGPRKVGRIIAVTILFVSGAIGAVNGVRELSQTLTPLQRSVSLGVLLYGVSGLAGGIALLRRHRSAVWLAAVWGVVVTYVSSMAAIAYAGPAATLGGAIGSGIGAALIAAAVVWAARLATGAAPTPTSSGARATTVALLMLASGASLAGCRQLYSGPAVIGDRTNQDGLATKIVRAKREPSRLIAQDLTLCWVAPDVFASIRPGDHWRCDWRRVPEGQ